MNPSRIKYLGAALAVLTVVGELAGSGPLLLGGSEAHAVIGRPLTPMSYAGVARRTTRRAVYTGAAYGAYGGYRPYGVYGAYVPPVNVVTTLPAGCAFVGGVYRCGAVSYQPYYNGPTVVYQRY